MVFGVTTSSSEIVRRINNDDDDDREKRGITKVLHETFHTLLNTEGGPSSGPSFPSPRCAVVHFGKLVSLIFVTTLSRPVSEGKVVLSTVG